MTTPRELEVTLGKGVVGTLTIPNAVDDPDFAAKGFAPATVKSVLILHGFFGHKNYCYQRQLAHKLASNLGYYALRIDFRGCGWSADSADLKEGRRLHQDMEDIDDSIDFLTDGSKNPLGISLELDAIVGHSRGSVAQMLWLKKENVKAKAGDPSAVKVPNIINCSARFDSLNVYDQFDLSSGIYDDGLPQPMPRYGKLQNVIITKNEIRDLAEADMSGLAEISTDTTVLSIYGTHDTVIPLNDCARFTNSLNRGPLTHELFLVENGDHNFMGTVEVETEDDFAEHNPDNLPMKGNLINYNSVVVEKVLDYLKPENQAARFFATTRQVGHFSRWKEVDGVSNFRDIGAWKLLRPTFSSSTHSDYYVRANLIYRSANFPQASEQGLKTLQSLGIKTIFDLTSDSDNSSDRVPKGLEKYGITTISVPTKSPSAQSLVAGNSNLSASIAIYEDLLESGVGAFTTIFQFIRDNADTPFTVHCASGKVSAVFSMLALLLVGLEPSKVARESELSIDGLKIIYESIKDKTRIKQQGKSADDKSDNQGPLEIPGNTSRGNAMLATIKSFNHKYGGVVSYFEKQLGFSSSDVTKIYSNLVTHESVDDLLKASVNGRITKPLRSNL